MKKEMTKFSASAVMKWLAVFVLLFAVTLPIAKEAKASANTYTVNVESGYLALRTAKAYDDRNEIGELYPGDTVEVQDYSDSTYWWVYSPKYATSGYVNCNYLVAGSTSTAWTVRVDSGYLALRNAKAYDSRNEIGELYTGETVYVVNASDASYWYVYSPKLGKYGYVNKDYLYGGSLPTTSSTSSSSSSTYTVKVDSGYLALRNAKAYDSRNEIGELYTGDTVQLLDTSDSTYWYVYSPKYDTNGYVNCNYLVGGAIETRTVRVDSGYLALRTAKAYDDRNEIGEMYTGETVQVISKDSGDYWYVYSTKLGKYGYANKNYLY